MENIIKTIVIEVGDFYVFNNFIFFAQIEYTD